MHSPASAGSPDEDEESLMDAAKLPEMEDAALAVLHEKAERPFGYAARLAAKRDAERVCGTGEESGDGGKVETACTLPEIVIEKLTKFSACL